MFVVALALACAWMVIGAVLAIRFWEVEYDMVAFAACLFMWPLFLVFDLADTIWRRLSD